MKKEFKGFNEYLVNAVISEGNPKKINNEYYVLYMIGVPAYMNKEGRYLFSKIPGTLEIAIRTSGAKHYIKFKKNLMDRFYRDYVKGDNRDETYLRYAEENMRFRSFAKICEDKHIEIFTLICIPYCKDTDYIRITKLQARSRDEEWEKIIK